MENYIVTHFNFHQNHDTDMSRYSLGSGSIQFVIDHQSASVPKQDPSL